MDSKTYIAKTLAGLEELLAEELNGIGAENVKILNRAVEFTGDDQIMFKANLYLRTALRILKPIYSFKTVDSTSLYRGALKLDWSEYLSLNETFVIDAVVNSEFFNHSGYVGLRVKDAIVDQFRNKYGKRPSVDTKRPHLRISVHLSYDDCTILLDTSGEPLFKRGYRLHGNLAPINEVLAAAMVKFSGWKGDTLFMDPMCGSGTIVIEAAMQALDIPAGIYRNEFAFERWKDMDLAPWYEMLSKEEERLENLPALNVKIIGSDISQAAIDIAEKNVEKAGLSKHITLIAKSFEKTIALSETGTIIINPPYGERLKKDYINSFYSMIGRRLKFKFENHKAWILSNNFDAIHHIGLHADSKKILYNGALECKFLEYSMYEGTKKIK